MLRMKAFFFIILICSTGFADSEIESDLKRFHENPEKFMNELPPEVVDGKIKRRGDINPLVVQERLGERLQIRDNIIAQSKWAFSPQALISAVDDPKILIEKGQVNTSIWDINNRGLNKSELVKMPWSDTYWPTYKGSIGQRYADPGFPKSKNWGENYGYVMSRPASSIFNSGSRNAINKLSPAEKYDLLVGDSGMTLTRYAWNMGKGKYESKGVVPSWEGICHGWNAANHMYMPMIYNPVTVRARNGTPITFFQSDIKALWAMFWANANVETRFAGQRCTKSKPPKNNLGRIMDETCWDINPATLYLGLTNQIGMNQRGFVIDSTFDYQVWNFTVAKYVNTFFNPQSLRPTGDLKQAILPLNKFTLDKFRGLRNPATAYVVGVVTDLYYTNATSATHKSTDKPILKALRIYYDLELDSNGNIIGGEWYTNAHPDFLWTYDVGYLGKGAVDESTLPEEWTNGLTPPSSWTHSAVKQSSWGMPLHKVVDRIVQFGTAEVEDPNAEAPRTDDDEPTSPTEPGEQPSTPPRSGNTTP